MLERLFLRERRGRRLRSNVDAEAQKGIEERIKKAGYKEPQTFVLEHGYCRSVYIQDPNGLISYHMPLAGSPLIDAGFNCPALDQRGASQVNACDIGAVEFGGVLPSR